LKFSPGINTLRIMSIKPPSRAITEYTIYAVIGTLLELGILVAIVCWGLPYVGIDMPVWAVILLAVLLLAFSYYTYTMGRKALNRKLLHEIEAMIGNTGIVATVHNDGGYIKIRGELWKALSDSKLSIGEEIVVVAVDGFRLVVAKKEQIGQT
jgi:membrane protein implicated in regulation of membrane protease activity